MRCAPLSFSLRKASVAMVLALTCIGQSQTSGTQKPAFRPDCNASFGQCGVGQPCLVGKGQDGNNLVFQFSGTSNDTNKSFDFYNVRRGNNQEESKNGYYVIYNVAPGTTYNIEVEGCVSHPLSHSACSGWVPMSLATHKLNAPPCPPTL